MKLYIFHIKPFARVFLACLLAMVAISLARASGDVKSALHSTMLIGESIALFVAAALILPHLSTILFAYLRTWKR